MKQPKRSRKTLMNVILIIGILLLAAAVCLFAWTRIQEARYDSRSKAILSALDKAIPKTGVKMTAADMAKTEADESETSGDDGELMTMIQIKGSSCVGRLSVPALHRSWPVGSVYGNLKEMPCRSTGTPDRNHFRIRGLKGSYHFSELARLTPGNKVRFTDVSGITYCYKVVNIIESSDFSRDQSDLMLYYRTRGDDRMMICCDFE
ncbi:MAG: hypothetical protein ACOYJJ_00870 [Anaerovoracaceae bacterium]